MTAASQCSTACQPLSSIIVLAWTQQPCSTVCFALNDYQCWALAVHATTTTTCVCTTVLSAALVLQVDHANTLHATSQALQVPHGH